MVSVLVVDDSVVVRRLIVDALSADPGIQVVGTAPNGKVALSKIDMLKPDIVTLDIEMPVMDGLTTIKEIRKVHPRLPVIMFSTLTSVGASATLEALASGASDYVTKPANVGSVSESIKSVREQIIPRIHALCRTGTPRGAVRPAPRLAPPPPRTAAGAGAGTPDIVAVGCSTGGPDALAKVVNALPATFPVPVVVVQHMPQVFTKMFAERLDRSSPLKVVEAQGEMTLTPGTVYIAPGDYHLEVARRGAGVVTHLQQGPPENFCRPAVDVLFRSVAKAYGGSTLGLILTGMGQDGKRGSEALVSKGAEIVAQDEATSVVWGMPGAVAGAGLAHSILPLHEISQHLISRVAGGRMARSRG
ncbi:chemotaxis response regulator protein-glutamate methylesterase of group 1 operon [Planomonospora parontospora subsp. parontospora]|uniref:Protein-glutamate methylesterase/protein-glutamine glutaminase n=2 Tax=Planomonospora parontospora TaxID=58119 RepID=A0AA37BN22_9ACTN|nr:chemotaxis response regulator protein-glutamate methylesterase [Planomonospora parontospora]GGK95812.1 chemotaxis response regulator protein-glutamate methylesterase of group 1 operon [Planomonospora parontospora]GII13000.1 chemotaxis response regulator protein-glutamate methylesterase of group 1 operon [Planomonospora parontospora subsp. parontospora]